MMVTPKLVSPLLATAESVAFNPEGVIVIEVGVEFSIAFGVFVFVVTKLVLLTVGVTVVVAKCDILLVFGVFVTPFWLPEILFGIVGDPFPPDGGVNDAVIGPEFDDVKERLWIAPCGVEKTDVVPLGPVWVSVKLLSTLSEIEFAS